MFLLGEPVSWTKGAIPSDVMVWDLETIPDIAGFAKANSFRKPDDFALPSNCDILSPVDHAVTIDQ